MLNFVEHGWQLHQSLHLSIVFGGTLLCIGLRGSYVRGEANEDGSMDIMMLLDRFTVKNMDAYRESWIKPAKAKRTAG